MLKKIVEGLSRVLSMALGLAFLGWLGYEISLGLSPPSDPPKRHLSPEARALNLCSPLVALDRNMELSIYSRYDRPAPKVEIEEMDIDSKYHNLKNKYSKNKKELLAKLDGKKLFIYDNNRWVEYSFFEKPAMICTLRSKDSGSFPDIFIGEELAPDDQ